MSGSDSTKHFFIKLIDILKFKDKIFGLTFVKCYFSFARSTARSGGLYIVSIPSCRSRLTRKCVFWIIRFVLVVLRHCRAACCIWFFTVTLLTWNKRKPTLEYSITPHNLYKTRYICNILLFWNNRPVNVFVTVLSQVRPCLKLEITSKQ